MLRLISDKSPVEINQNHSRIKLHVGYYKRTKSGKSPENKMEYQKNCGKKVVKLERNSCIVSCVKFGTADMVIRLAQTSGASF